MATRCQRLTPSLSFHHIRSFTSSAQPICIISLLLRVILSKSPGCPFPPSYRCATEEKPYVFSMFPLWHKQEPMQTIDCRTREDLEYASSFLLPDIFDDDEREVVIQDTDSDSAQGRRRWKEMLSTVIATLLLVMDGCRKALTVAKHTSTSA